MEAVKVRKENKVTYGEMFKEVTESGKYNTTITKLKRLAQLIYSNDREQRKTDCVWEAIEKYEDMTGIFFDPTQENVEDILDSL